MAWVFELRERRVRSWRPYEDRGRGAARRRLRRTRPAPPDNLQRMADAASTESIAPRLAAVREQLSLLSDYL